MGVRECTCQCGLITPWPGFPGGKCRSCFALDCAKLDYDKPSGVTQDDGQGSGDAVRHSDGP